MSKIGQIFKKKAVWIPIVSLFGLCLICTIAFLIYTACYYRADETALAVLNERDDIVVEDNLIYIPSAEQSSTGIIFYPGGNVEAIAYLPMMSLLSEQNYNVIIVEMPLNMAVFNINGADKVIEKYTDINSWYICGHSLGGAMASKYAEDNQDKIDGLIVLGSYVYGEFPTEKSTTIYGSLNDSLEENIDYDDNIVKIEGGNHAQFGNYGEQYGDTPATISATEQQSQGVDAIVTFINKMQQS